MTVHVSTTGHKAIVDISNFLFPVPIPCFFGFQLVLQLVLYLAKGPLLSFMKDFNPQWFCLFFF